MANNEEASVHGRFGYVSAYDPARHMARIQFPDKDNLVSAWIPVAIPNSLKNRDEVHLDVGEHVFCCMLGNGLESGVVLCSVYDDKNKPSEHKQEIRCVTFEDGTKVSYDRKKHILSVDCVGDIELKASGNIKLTASRIDLN